jgi:hypothetical protein
VLDDDEIPWSMKKFAGKGCRGWKMVEGVISEMTRGDSGWAIHEGKNC